ncbi:MAG: hypothetical protein ACJ795_23790 [Ktedonobacteraceae bacterium]
MKDLSCQQFPWRRALLRLVAIMMIVPALFLSFGSLIPGTAQAHSLASNISPQGHIDVKPAVKHDVSPPLRSIKAVHNAVARQHPLLHLPKLRQGAPNGIHDHVQHAGDPLPPPHLPIILTASVTASPAHKAPSPSTPLRPTPMGRSVHRITCR